MERILVIHGPNLNLLGQREPGLYGATTLEELNEEIRKLAEALGAQVDCFQSNAEGELIDRVQSARGGYDGMLLNAGAYTHTSIALRDALIAVGLPAVEVHITNIYGREPFRQQSFLADVVIGQVTGFGKESYLLALRGLVGHLRARRTGGNYL
ncbi:MAG: type II 3-dehydroquinate dehydratase [Deltaproteobacteria bacterium]|nr:type II 3-dehydroquinate dehydratase [Deltaproteobacteria bacterium]MBI3077303.1 type II 3-dehydroquinate dehydratase [Deltaproteobacteria bacterium]